MRVPPAEFLALDLEVHARLTGVPLRDVSVVDLPGGGDERTMADVRRLLEAAGRRPAFSVRVLVGLRRLLGRLFGWDASGEPLHLLYERQDEMLSEARNATVHAFSCMALRRRAPGYRLYWAIYVENVSALTPLYMAAIEPFRRFVVYPRVLGSIRAAWASLPPRRAAP
ncbi:MAG TPA: DUF2867 domain-containing protein [Methylomirabilota bacterium]|nr:DUF2867 domain-containing protein [Methylomirabilota bacterium]